MSNVIDRDEGFLYDPYLQMLAESLNDFEEFRKAHENRMLIFKKDADLVDKDGIARGKGISPAMSVMADLEAISLQIKETEALLVKDLEKRFKKHPLGKWVKSKKGLGYKTVARLLAVTHDPYYNPLTEEARTVSQLWAYCGMHVVNGAAPKRKRGEQANWDPNAGPRLHNILDPIIKTLSKPCGRINEDDEFAVHLDSCTCSPYRVMYDLHREKHVDAIHQKDCVRCGPKGKPALAGSKLSLAHKHARALRVVKKAVLKDLWLEAKRLHGEPE